MQINYFRWIKAEHLKKSTSFPGILNAFNITSLWKEEKNHQILEYFEKKKRKVTGVVGAENFSIGAEKKSCTGECWKILQRNDKFCVSKEILKFRIIF